MQAFSQGLIAQEWVSPGVLEMFLVTPVFAEQQLHLFLDEIEAGIRQQPSFAPPSEPLVDLTQFEVHHEEEP